MTITAGIPTAASTMAERQHVGTRMGLLQPRCTENLFYVLTLLEIVGTLALVFYALLREDGNVVDLPDKRIGFYNICLWNDTAGELLCLKNKQLQAVGISLPPIVLARVFVSFSPALIMLHFVFVLNLKCKGHRDGWKMILIIPFIEMIILSGSLGMFLSETSQWIHPSAFTGGFLALLGALALLLLQILTATVYLCWPKHIPKCAKAN